MKFNKELQWLAETLGVPLKAFANNGHLSGAIFSRMVDIIEPLLDRLEQGEEFRAVEDFKTDGVSVTRGQMVMFERLDNLDATKPWQLVMSVEEGVEFKLDMWDFIRKFRFGDS